MVYWDSHGGSIFTWASRHKLRIFASVQLFWMGPQMPSDPQSLFTTPLLFTGHGACATKPALVTFQATTEKSSGQVVSPSEQGSVRPQQPQYSQSLCSDQNLCRPRYLTQWQGTKEETPCSKDKPLRGQPTGPGAHIPWMTVMETGATRGGRFGL